MTTGVHLDPGTRDETAVGMFAWGNASESVRLPDTKHMADAWHWWARGWDGLRKRERRRLRRMPWLLAAHARWAMERNALRTEFMLGGLAELVMPRAQLAETMETTVMHPKLKLLSMRVVPQFDGTGDTIWVNGPIYYEEEP